jgi:hypothetical protein
MGKGRMVEKTRRSNEKINRARVAQAWFASQQDRMRADLEEIRTVQDHPTSKGDGSELSWLTILQSRLPARYRAERAFVIDSLGHKSEQIDIVIHDRQYCPVLLDTAGGITIPAESVYAIFEVKQDITKGNMVYASDKIESVRKLRRTSVTFKHATGTSQTKPKAILGGILAFHSGWKPSFGKSFMSAIGDLPLPGRIDIGCALVDGAFSVEYRRSAIGSISFSDSSSSLVFWMFELLRRLQAIGTVPAIDYKSYSELLVHKGTSPKLRET